MKSNLPRHAAFIMDGNGRWAARRLLPRAAGHEAGARTLRKITEACFERGIEYVSVFAFSTENNKRPAEEKDKLFDLLRRFFRRELGRFIKSGTRITIMGDLSALPPDAAAVAADAVKKTAACDKRVLNIGLNYGGRAEIARAFNLMTAAGERDITEETVGKYLYTSDLPDPDLLIRTGERRLSNFMLWQCAYSEIYFTDTPWPAFTVKALDKALADFAGRDRKFGGL